MHTITIRLSDSDIEYFMDNTTEKVVEYSRIFDRLLTSTRISTREVLLDLKFIFDF